MAEIWTKSILASFYGQEWIIVGLLAILLFGSRLPKIARSLGLSIGQFKKGLKNVKDEVDAAGDDDGDAAPADKKTAGDDDKPEKESGESSG